MSTQFLTDERMLLASVIVFVTMLGIAAILIVWRDWDVIWIDAFLVIQAVLIYYYYALAADPSHAHRAPGTIILIPLSDLLARPAVLALWVLILTYSLVRLRLKYKVRHGKF